MAFIDSYVRVAIDGAGKKIRNLLNTIGADDVYQQVVTLAKSDGSLLDDPSRSSVTQPVSAAALPLPTGATTEATLALIKTRTDNLDIALSALRDAIAGGKTQQDIINALGSVVAVVSGVVAVSNFPADQLVHQANIDVLLSSRLKPGDSVAISSLPHPIPRSATLDDLLLEMRAVRIGMERLLDEYHIGFPLLEVAENAG